MPNSVLVTFLLELLLILLTTLLLSQPKFLYQGTSPRIQGALSWFGMFFLCMTFCWSVIFGIVLSMNDISIQF